MPETSRPSTPTLPLMPELCRAFFDHARATFPEECCGIIVGIAGNPALQVYEPWPNLQTSLHLQDPHHYPRDGRTAFAFDALKLERHVDALKEQGRGLVAVVHSHPTYPAYFSQTDRQAAAPFGFPTWEGAWHLVISVYGASPEDAAKNSGSAQDIRDLKGFFWNDTLEEFEEGILTGVPPLPGPLPGAVPLGED